MNLTLTPENVAESISSLISKNKLWEGKNLSIFFITNGAAGCFTNKKKSKKYAGLFAKTREEVEGLPVVTKSLSYKIFKTEYSGHAKELAESVVTQTISLNEKDVEYVIVSVGGDGTSLEVQTALFKMAQENQQKKEIIMNKITVLRLPLGTGNDGTDGHSLPDLIDLLKGELKFENEQAIKIYPEKEPTEEQIKASGKNPAKYCDVNYKAPWYSFNIASIGVDAYVVYMTNAVKQRVPGNFYHICVPLSGIVYDKDFPTGNAHIEMFDKDGNLTETLDSPLTLAAFGCSGHRTYGGGHHILPTDDNFCFAPHLSLLKLVKENPKFVDGSFVGGDTASLHSAEKIRISYDQAILLQCDGEVAMLCKDHFPLIMEKTEPCLRVVKKA